VPVSLTLTAVRRAIFGLLAGDSTLRGLLGAPAYGTNAIYQDQAPEDAEYPFVLFSKSSGSAGGAFRSMGARNQEDVWQIKAVSQSSSADEAEGIADRLAYLLDGKASSLSVSNGTPINFVRESDVNYPEPDGGVTYYHVGSLYRLSVDEK
jgi:Protein of unknown function (DUF3168)